MFIKLHKLVIIYVLNETNHTKKILTSRTGPNWDGCTAAPAFK